MDFTTLEKALLDKIPFFQVNGRKPEDYETFDALADEVFGYYYGEAKGEFEGQYRSWLSQGMEGYRTLLDLEERLERAGVADRGEEFYLEAERDYIRWREGDQQALEHAGGRLRSAGVITARMTALEDVMHFWLLYGHLDLCFIPYPFTVPYSLDETKEVPEGMRNLRERAIEENISANDFGGKTTLFYDWCGDILNYGRTAAMGRLQDWGIYVRGTQGKQGENLPLMIERLKEGKFSTLSRAPF